MRQADVVTAGSQGLIEKTREVVKLDGERLAFAPLGVDVEMFSPEGRHLSPSLRHRNPQELLPSIVNVGSLQAVKGQADLIHAFRFVVDREPKARLAIVGDGPLRTHLEALARQLDLADRMSFAGDVRRERLPETYRAASVYVQSSLHESQGMAMLEAAACGLPIVGTPVGALADLAPEAALTAPCGDPLRMAQAILSVLGDADRRRALGEAARTRVEQVYRLEAAADRFEALYQS
jgi:glycosyltransferase involved in cell wall biosynthesis